MAPHSYVSLLQHFINFMSAEITENTNLNFHYTPVQVTIYCLKQPRVFILKLLLVLNVLLIEIYFIPKFQHIELKIIIKIATQAL